MLFTNAVPETLSKWQKVPFAFSGAADAKNLTV
jgi:hypothetical protein